MGREGGRGDRGRGEGRQGKGAGGNGEGAGEIREFTSLSVSKRTNTPNTRTALA